MVNFRSDSGVVPFGNGLDKYQEFNLIGIGCMANLTAFLIHICSRYVIDIGKEYSKVMW